MFALQDIVIFAMIAGILAGALLAIWPWARRRGRFLVAGLTTIVGFIIWNLVLNTTNATGFLVDAPVIPISWQDAGSGILAFTVTELALGDAIYTDLVMSARFKPISGQTDRAAGLIFRAQDKDNYYILRANALENNVNVYKYVGGRRIGIKDSSASVPSGQWQELRVEVSGSRLRGFLNNQLVVEANDDTYRAGKVGLWTKADSVTCFDDVEARAQ